MKPKTKLIIALVFLVIGIGTLLLYVYKDKIFGSKTPSDQSQNNNQPPAAFPLKKGSSGPYVKAFQKYLLTQKSDCLPKYGADGYWGDETEGCAQSVLGSDVVDYTKYKSLGIA